MKVYEMSAQEKLSSALQAVESNKKNKTGEPGEKNNLGKDSFLKLLVTELRHQDPTKPMEDREFIAQMAQFSSLEQITNLNKEMKNLASSSKAAEAYGILGKDIQAYDQSRSRKIEGTVRSFSYKGDEIVIRVGNDELPIKDIHSVSIKQ